MTTRAEAEEALRGAMDRYGFRDADGGHDTSGAQCWCDPERICAECQAEAPCIHGTERPTLIVHRRSS